MKKHSISFGTSCMGRLHHLQETYIKNIQTALDVDVNSKFVLLNYNSQDGMHDWVQTNLKDYMAQGIVKYLKTTKPRVFSQSHTKNITARSADADIVCNLDADNFLSRDYLAQNLTFFKNNKYEHKISKPPAGGNSGRIMCYKKDLLEIGGFNECMTGWGFEDNDFFKRFKMYFSPYQEFIPPEDKQSYIRHPKNKEEENISRQKNTQIHIDMCKLYWKTRDKTVLVANKEADWGKI